ncbi:MAG: transporter substrate-binding domain-containing protein [Arenimonas sp.]|uniref:transporter substrate-binding domain-containing protein n=1 Tax=Arenimonas sp. TaxID=1872635 RepID=UPI0025C68F70|nr:transporter substrate-binding domain-containing protein [Arenimonas sp.]MBW8367043.1 transporter substrate-binding domain-containing protein [Arenimonas sp.]
MASPFVRPSIRPSIRPSLRVGIVLSAPWALAEDLRLDGIEVREARRYAHWLGRELQWRLVTPDQLPQALNQKQLDLAIGGLGATPELRASARLATFSTHRLHAHQCPHGVGYRHVWAVSRGAWRDWAAANAFLQVVRHRNAAAHGRH